MDTIPEHEVLRLRLVMRALAGLSAAVHCALCVYSLVMHLQAPPASPHRFALYHARVSAGPSVAADLARAAAGTCAPWSANATRAPDVLVLRSNHTQQSWLPQRADAAVDGSVLLAVVFFLSFLAQAFATYTTFREEALETFRQPCLPRWLELAATAPLQLVLVAVCVLIRDAQTLGLLAAAQAACVLLGFALEFALGAADLQDPIESTFSARSPPAVAVPCELRIGTLVCGPNLDERYFLTHAQKAARAFDLCFGVASVLHAAVWAVVLSQLDAVQAALCADAPQPWAGPLRLLVGGQAALLPSFGVVLLLQRLWLWAGHADASSTFLYGSVAHTVLAFVAKALLAASYVAFVELLPLRTVA
jgi:hypothetical protein